MTPRRPREDDELPELPALEGDDEPPGDAAGSIALCDEAATLDDAAADIALDHDLEELREGLGDDDGALDVGRDDDDLVLTDGESALDERGIEDRGAGVPPERVTELVQRFVTTRIEGTGTGLLLPLSPIHI